MAVVNKMELGRELFKTVSQVNRMIDQVSGEAKTLGIDPITARTSNGDFALVPLLAAKAQCLHALAITNQRD